MHFIEHAGRESTSTPGRVYRATRRVSFDPRSLSFSHTPGKPSVRVFVPASIFLRVPDRPVGAQAIAVAQSLASPQQRQQRAGQQQQQPSEARRQFCGGQERRERRRPGGRFPMTASQLLLLPLLITTTTTATISSSSSSTPLSHH